MYNYDYINDRKLDYYNFKNNNYNLPEYTENVDKNMTYDPYQGFIRGNIFKNLYNSYKIDKPFEITPGNEQAEMLTYIDAYGFACNDLALYLDIYEFDKDTLNLFNKYRNEYNELINEYQKRYGSLFRTSEANQKEWNWNKSPWPWEN